MKFVAPKAECSTVVPSRQVYYLHKAHAALTAEKGQLREARKIPLLPIQGKRGPMAHQTPVNARAGAYPLLSVCALRSLDY